MDGETRTKNSVAGSARSVTGCPGPTCMTGIMVILCDRRFVCTMIAGGGDAAAQSRTSPSSLHEIKYALFGALNQKSSGGSAQVKAQLLKSDPDPPLLRRTRVVPRAVAASQAPSSRPSAGFFPRYVRILTSSKYRDSISEVRSRTHLLGRWNGVASPRR